jgi:3-dehydroquinate synthase class II
VKASNSARARLKVLGRVAVAGFEGVDDAVVLGVHGVGVGLVEYGAHLGHLRQRALGHPGE